LPKPDKNKICIYCAQDDPGRFIGVEHVVPQSFGTFGSETPTLDCVCDECNAYFGRELDQLLARDTIEGVMRYNRGRFSSEPRAQKRLHIVLSESAETGDFAGLKVNIDATTGKVIPPRAQFLILNLLTGKWEAYFEHQLGGLKLPEKTYGHPEARKTKAFAASKDELDQFVLALHAHGIDYSAGKALQPPQALLDENAQDGTLPLEIEQEIDSLHKRALAKILMNFVAQYLGVAEALSPRWDFLRNYVQRGEGAIRMRLSDRPFWTGQETDQHRFSDDSINIRVENSGADIIGVLQFYNSLSYEFTLVENDSLPPQFEVGFRFTPGFPPVPGEKRLLGAGTSRHE
jgi:hypothetical protein